MTDLFEVVIHSSDESDEPDKSDELDIENDDYEYYNDNDIEVEEIEEDEEDEGDICLICQEIVCNNDPYAVINSDDEVHKYHVECLESWFEKNYKGIITRKDVKSWSIMYLGNLFIEKIINKKEIKKNNRRHHMRHLEMAERQMENLSAGEAHDVLQRLVGDNEIVVNYYNNRNQCSGLWHIMAIVWLIILFVLGIIIIIAVRTSKH